MSEPQPQPRRAKARIPLLVFIILAVTVALGWIWILTDVQRQDKYLRSALALFLGVFLFLLWVVILSGWRPRVRWTVLGTVGFVIIFCPLTMRISGVTGDLFPIVEWRWKTRAPIQVKLASPRQTPSKTSRIASFPQFLGPDRDAILRNTAIAPDWKQSPPQELWRRPVGAAWSGFAIEGSRALTQEQRGEEELVTCYQVETGAPLWTHIETNRYFTTLAGEGPRATPTISSNRVYAMGARGILTCLDLESGKLLWRHDTLAEAKAELPMWGVACSPLLTDRAVIVTVGGRGHAMVAYDRQTGARLWASGNDDPHWCSPIRATLAGVPQIVVFSQNVSAYREDDGKLLWFHPWSGSWPRVSTPVIVSSNRVLVSQGYGGGAELLQITHTDDRWRAERLWKSIRLKSKFASIILKDGYIYGLDDGALVSLDLTDGALKWKGDRYGHGQLLLVGNILLITAENGDIVLVEPNPTEQRELARHKVFTTKTWNPPALAGDLLLVRNDREAACLRIKLKTP